MKRMILYFPLIALLISSFGCEKLKCHREFTFVNNTSDSVVIGNAIHNVYGNCNINRWNTVSPNGEAENDYRHCLEAEFSKKNLEFYMIAADNFNNQEDFYPCDSIEFMNEILEEYSVTLDELQENDFKVYYP
ncbi:MAG: hypothetical protein ABR574_11425 [Cryomorphaceae bacterium]|nr:hypothetical protein [Flavobacteriales bacterium]